MASSERNTAQCGQRHRVKTGLYGVNCVKKADWLGRPCARPDRGSHPSLALTTCHWKLVALNNSINDLRMPSLPLGSILTRVFRSSHLLCICSSSYTAKQFAAFSFRLVLRLYINYQLLNFCDTSNMNFCLFLEIF